MQALKFLELQCETQFNGDQMQFQEFLKLLLIKHKDILNDDSINAIVQLYFKKFQLKSNALPIDNKQQGTSTYEQVLAMHYILQQLNVSFPRSKAAKARLIKMLSGKNTSEIEKILDSPLDTKTPAHTRATMQSLMKYFEDLKLDKIVNAIQSDLITINNSKIK
jgi:hypothetical protein